jgi:hypothetical protein
MNAPEIAPTASSRQLWWQQHKNDPRIVECMREARRKYYYKNQDKEKQRGREYYHKRKALLNLPTDPHPQGLIEASGRQSPAETPAE